MQTFTAGQANTVYLDLVAKATGDAITTGTVNFYLVALSGANAGKWFQASGDTWQAAEVPAGAATYKGGASWQLSVSAAAWIQGVKYSLYAKESGDLHIPYSDIITDAAGILSLSGVTEGGNWTIAKLLKVTAAWMSGKWRLKSETTGTYEILDPDDDSTIVMEVTPNETSPYKTVSIKI